MNSVVDVCALIEQHVTHDGVRIESDTRLMESGLLDSMTVLNIVVSLERECGVRIPEMEIVAANFRTPEHLWRLVCGVRELAGGGVEGTIGVR
jgi:acyl carrier protein